MAETKRAPAKKPAPRKTVGNVVVAVEEEVKHLEEAVVTEADKLEGLTVQQLRVLHDEALVAESEARRLVHVLRQRAANAAVDADVTAEEMVIAAKKKLAETIDWVRQVEKKLENEYLDIYGVKKQ
jgi:hypothetical protein